MHIEFRTLVLFLFFVVFLNNLFCTITLLPKAKFQEGNARIRSLIKLLSLFYRLFSRSSYFNI